MIRKKKTNGRRAARGLQKISERIGPLITFHSTVEGKWPSMAELHERLQQYRRIDVIMRLASFSAFTESWKTVRGNELDIRLRNYVLPSWHERFRLWTEQYGEGFVFSRFTLLWLMRQALIACTGDGKAITTREDLEAIGEACLIANDLSAFLAPKPLPTEIDVAANLLPNTEYFSHEDFDRDIARTLHLLTELAPDCPGTILPGVAARIQELLGYTVSEYADLSLAAAMNPLSVDTQDPEKFINRLISPQNFATTTIAVESAERFLNSISADEATLHDHLDGAATHPADLTLFRKWPFLRHGEQFYPLDSGFILDKAGRSLFWTALKNCPGAAERENILNSWGELFELHVNGVLGNNLGLQSQFLKSPRFEDEAQAFDGCVLEGNVLVVLEYKASTVKNAVRYADDPGRLRQLLEERFVQGEGQHRKGLAQLANSLRRFADGDCLIERRSGTVIHPDSVKKVVPVLVHLDSALRTPGIPGFMATRFKSFGRLKRFTVTPLVLLPVTELEELEGHLGDMALVEIFESFLSMLRGDRGAVFITRHLPILNGKARKVGTTLQRFDDYMDGMLHRLFPNESAVED